MLVWHTIAHHCTQNVVLAVNVPIQYRAAWPGHSPTPPPADMVFSIECVHQSSAVQARQLVPGSATNSAFQTNKLLPLSSNPGFLGSIISSMVNVFVGPPPSPGLATAALPNVFVGPPPSAVSGFSLGQFSATSTSGGSAAARVSVALSDQKLRRGAGVQLKLNPCNCHHQHQQKPHCHCHCLLRRSLHLQRHQGSVDHQHYLSRRFEHGMYAGAQLRVCTADTENNGPALL